MDEKMIRDIRTRQAMDEMEGKTGSATFHFKHGKLLKIEYRIIENAEAKNK